MSSSYALPNLYFPTRVLLLLLFLGCFLPASSSALRKHVKNSWRTPCAGATPVPMMFTLMMGDLKFEELSRSSSVLKRIVITLKNDYIAARLRHMNPEEEESIASSLKITGSPSWTTVSDHVNETLLICYENLARLAVLTRLTKEGEASAADRERHHFANRFHEIEVHPDGGLYVILCKLYLIMEELGIEAMSPATEAEVSSIRFEAVRNNAIRHVRDYLVLIILENSADQLHSRFNRLAS